MAWKPFNPHMTLNALLCMYAYAQRRIWQVFAGSEKHYICTGWPDPSMTDKAINVFNSFIMEPV